MDALNIAVMNSPSMVSADDGSPRPSHDAARSSLSISRQGTRASALSRHTLLDGLRDAGVDEITGRKTLPSQRMKRIASKMHEDTETARALAASTSTAQSLLGFTSAMWPRVKKLTDAEKAEREAYRKVVERLVGAETLTWTAWAASFWRTVPPVPLLPTSSEPKDTAVRDACAYFFPRLADTPIYVCDFKREEGIDRSREREERVAAGGCGGAPSKHITLSELESWVHHKPGDVDVRWIHVPLGPGLLHSTAEDIFRYAGSQNFGLPFEHAGQPMFPYVELDMLTFASESQHRRLTQALEILEEYTNRLRDENSDGEDEGDNEHYDDDGKHLGPNNRRRRQATQPGPVSARYGYHGFPRTVRDDLEWRSDLLGRPLDFWQTVQGNYPYPLSRRLLDEPGALNVGRDISMEKQRFVALAGHPQYRDTLLAVCRLQAFHRDDGFLLTMGHLPGVDYLTRSFRQHLAEPKDLINNGDASVIGHVREAFLTTGTSTWHRPTVEWLLVYLMTEAAVTPHDVRYGRSCVSPMTAYKELAEDLEKRHHHRWVRGESVELIGVYLMCITELEAIHRIVADKISLMHHMRLDIDRMEEQYNRAGVRLNSGIGIESMHFRVEWATRMLEAQMEHVQDMIKTFRTAQEHIFKLRSIEANDLAVTAEAQNRAVLAFTSVTIVFLPLSFFTSYFGMNLQGIATTTRSEAWFWKMCGSAALVIVVFTALVVSVVRRVPGIKFLQDIERELVRARARREVESMEERERKEEEDERRRDGERAHKRGMRPGSFAVAKAWAGVGAAPH